jgi:hypothetical protein
LSAIVFVKDLISIKRQARCLGVPRSFGHTGTVSSASPEEMHTLTRAQTKTLCPIAHAGLNVTSCAALSVLGSARARTAGPLRTREQQGVSQNCVSTSTCCITHGRQIPRTRFQRSPSRYMWTDGPRVIVTALRDEESNQGSHAPHPTRDRQTAMLPTLSLGKSPSGAAGGGRMVHTHCSF